MHQNCLFMMQQPSEKLSYYFKTFYGNELHRFLPRILRYHLNVCIEANAIGYFESCISHIFYSIPK